MSRPLVSSEAFDAGVVILPLVFLAALVIVALVERSIRRRREADKFLPKPDAAASRTSQDYFRRSIN